MDSPHPPKSVQNTMAKCVGNNVDYRVIRFVNGYVTIVSRLGLKDLDQKYVNKSSSCASNIAF